MPPRVRAPVAPGTGTQQAPPQQAQPQQAQPQQAQPQQAQPQQAQPQQAAPTQGQGPRTTNATVRPPRRPVRRVVETQPVAPAPVQVTLAEHMRRSTLFETLTRDMPTEIQTTQVHPVEGGAGTAAPRASPRAPRTRPAALPPPRRRRRRERDPVMKIEKNKENLTIKDLDELMRSMEESQIPRITLPNYDTLPVDLSTDLSTLAATGRGGHARRILGELPNERFTVFRDPPPRNTNIQAPPVRRTLPVGGPPAGPTNPNNPNNPTATPARRTRPVGTAVRSPRTPPPEAYHANARVVDVHSRQVYMHAPPGFDLSSIPDARMMPGPVIEEVWETDNEAPLVRGIRPRRLVRRV
ncbi:hypothetical protein EDC01DRAFT_776892 [Geopyxis carbonaria]|nr:hypothetical protein EDC01DRAFT_776892 [Geopyxis carbonaria]